LGDSKKANSIISEHTSNRGKSPMERSVDFKALDFSMAISVAPKIFSDIFCKSRGALSVPLFVHPRGLYVDQQ
jgi:hypothetical protein